MIDKLSIRNFQSLAAVELSLAPLTVIVGPSSSGKSALIRALRALVANRRGTEFITHGERTASISAHITSTDPLRSGTVTLTRSTMTAPNSYTLLPDDPNHSLYPKAEFTKLGGDVPTPISEFLGIPTAQVPLAIASQFDKPYLLDTPGPEVARIFASLTNAHIILNAARESNRQKLSSNQTLRTRADDLEAIRARVPEFKALKAQRESLERGEALIVEGRALTERTERLEILTDTMEIAEARIPALSRTLAEIPVFADIDAPHSRYLQVQKRLERLDAILAILDGAQAMIDTQTERLATMPSLGSIDALAETLSERRLRLEAYTDTIRAVSLAQRAVAERAEALEQKTVAHTEARTELAEAMLGISAGFLDYFRAHATTLTDDTLDVAEAAKLAALFVSTLDA